MYAGKIIVIILLCMLLVGCAKKNSEQVDNSAIINRVAGLVGNDVIVTYSSTIYQNDSVVAGTLINATVNRNGSISCSIMDISGDMRYINTDIDSIKLVVVNETK